MINDLKIDGVIRERTSKALFTNEHSHIEIRCYECGDWIEIKKILSEHITARYVCGGCSRKLKLAERAKEKAATQKEKVPTAEKKLARFKNSFPDNCPHKPFFGCRSANSCQGCYYNPNVKIALMPRFGHEDDGDKKTAKEHWFYGDKKNSAKSLAILDDIKHGRGLMPGGNRCYFKYSKRTNDEE